MKYIEEVIQEFEKKFCKSLLGYDLKFLTSEERANINQLKEFIQSALQKQIEMIEGEVKGSICDGCRGAKSWEVACCDGSRNCPCNGQPYGRSVCEVCDGTGKGDILSILNQYK